MRIYPWSVRCLIAASMLMLCFAPVLFAEDETASPDVVAGQAGGDAGDIGAIPEDGGIAVDEPIPEDSGDVVLDDPVPDDGGDVVLEDPVEDCGVACMSEPPPEVSDCGEACMHTLGGDADGEILQFSNGGDSGLTPEINVDAIGAGIADYVDTANEGSVDTTGERGVLVTSPPIDMAQSRSAGRSNGIRSGHLQ